MQPSLVIKQGTSQAQVIQPSIVNIPISVSSSMAGSIPNMMTLNKAGGQNMVVTAQNLGTSQQSAILPNVQILNMRPGAPAVAAQKSVAAVSPRVVIGAPQVVSARPPAPGITLQTLQSLQPGQQGHLLLKTENGQYQLLRVGPAPAPAAAVSTLAAPPSQTIRLSTVPAQLPGVATVSTSMAPQMPTHMAASVSGTPLAATPLPQQHHQPQTPAPAPAPTYVKPSDNTKEKCRNFLANLLDLSSKEPPSVEINVRTLIQELIDAQVEPEEFCDRLERLLNASPQPCLIGFLKKSLPLLRQSLVIKELVIDGINPPAPHVAFSNIPPPAPIPQAVMPTASYQMKTPAKAVGNTVAVLQNIPLQTKINVSKVNSGKGVAVSKANFQRAGGSSTVLTPGKSLLKDKERKSSTQFTSQQYSEDKMAGDDDINDVAAMGGVNLAEETQRILGSTEMIGTQIRSCKDEYFVPLGLMQARVKFIAASNGLEDSLPDVSSILSHALQERLKTVLEKLAVIAQHRIDVVKSDGRYEVTQDVKGQLKFLEELDRVDKKRREDSEREILLRAAKSRSKNEDPEQAKLKAKAKEMQRAELEELRQREANLTALQAIGPRKKPRLEGPGGAGDSPSTSALPAATTAGLTGRSQMALRTRFKRINHRDMMFLLETDRDTAHSLLLYKSYLK